MLSDPETDDFNESSLIMSHTPEKWKLLVRRSNNRKGNQSSLLMYGLNKRLRPADCLPLLKNPTLHNYRLLRDFLRNGDHIWMEDFLAREGLIMLLTGLEALSTQIFRLEDVMVLLENISCIREVLNSEPGIEYIVRSEYDRTAVQLARALSSENIPVKHHVYELLSALCAYSPNGFRLAYKCLKRCQESHRPSHLFCQVVGDLRKYSDDETKFAYKASLLAFVNCMITFCEDSKRDEVLLELDNSFFFEILCRITMDDHSAVQVQIDGMLKTLEDIDENRALNLSVQKTVTQILKIADTDQKEKVTSILNRIAVSCMDSDKRDTVLEKLEVALSTEVSVVNITANVAHQATSPIVLPEPHPRPLKSECSLPGDQKDATGYMDEAIPVPPPPPPPPPPPAPTTNKVQPSRSMPLPPPPPPVNTLDINRNIPVPPVPPPPPAPPQMVNGVLPPLPPVPPPPPNKLSNGVPPPPPPMQTGVVRSGTWSGPEATKKAPQQLLKPLRWNKLFAPVEKLSHSVWRQTSTDETLSVDADHLKTLFKENDDRRASVVGTLLKTSSQMHELIDSKRSLKVNVCLKKFKDISVKELVGFIDRLDVTHFDLDDLIGLMGILPTAEEAEVFKDYHGNVDELDSAEAFFYWIVKLPDFALHVELMLCSKEFPLQAGALLGSFRELKEGCDLILRSKSFRDFLHYVLQVGNVLNTGRTLGEAKAVKVDGLLKLAETSSNEPKVSLLHFIVQELRKQHSSTLDFIESFEPLGKASGLEFGPLQAECQLVLSRYDDIHKRLGTTTESFQQLVASCLKDPKALTFRLKSSREELVNSIKMVAEYFVEDPSQFKIEECFKNISLFVKHISSVIKELEEKEHNQAKEKTEERQPKISRVGIRLPGISTLPRNFGGLKILENAADDRSMADDLDARIVDELTKAINSGAPLRRLRRRS